MKNTHQALKGISAETPSILIFVSKIEFWQTPRESNPAQSDLESNSPALVHWRPKILPYFGLNDRLSGLPSLGQEYLVVITLNYVPDLTLSVSGLMREC